MKKYRLCSFFLALVLLLGIFLSVPALAAEDMHVAATAALLVDADYGDILYEQDAHEKRFPASITKVMTGLLAIEAIDRGTLSLDQAVTASATVNQGMMSGASSQDIKTGEVLTLRDVLYCALMPSANEACNMLAEVVSGSIPDFVALMNQRAAALGCENTHFMNPHGLHDDNHYTTAYDIYLIAAEAMKHPTFREIVSSKSYVVPATNLHPERTLHDTNALVSTFRIRGYHYEYATGIKTGFTPEAGQCLVSSATKGERSLIAVVLGAQNVPQADGSSDRQSFSESKRLLEWGFSSFSRRTLIDSTALLADIPVTLSKQAEKVAVQPSGSLAATLPNDMDLSAFAREITLTAQTLEAPVTKGQVLGSVTLTYEGKDYGTLSLVAVSSVSRSELLYRLHQIGTFFSQLWVKIALLVLLLLALVLVLRKLVFGTRRNHHGHRSSGYSGNRRRRK